jgi:hypothetical protein
VNGHWPTLLITTTWANVTWPDFPDKQAKKPVRIPPITEASVELYYDDPQWNDQQQQQHRNLAITNLCPLLQGPKTDFPTGVLVGPYLSPSKMRQLYNQSKIATMIPFVLRTAISRKRNNIIDKCAE